MLTNDIKKGAKLVLTGGRCATMEDNAKGIIRMVKTDETNGYFAEMGSVYADEIVGVVLDGDPVPGKKYLLDFSTGNIVEPAELAPAHAKKLTKIRTMLP